MVAAGNAARDRLRAPGAHLRLAAVALEHGRPREALWEVASERRVSGASADLDILAARAWARLGDHARARVAYRRALRLQPENAAARDSMRALEGGRGS